ncbi:formin-like protein 4 [Phragmites australis]|uniref:formin-like protein 4 n=1 Tax=Phragmites australis TaxID=29695 RepID=UPI002D774431|nr:formin-like protein 4 [Phragmites australis]
MERKGGCCLAPRYGGSSAGAGAQASTAWQMGSIMLKFRPIAPKPAAMAPVPSPSPAPVAPAGAGRGKRKAVGGGGGRRGRKPNKAATVKPVTAVPATVAVQKVGERKESEKEKPLSSRSSSSSGMTSVDSSPPPPPPMSQPATLPLLPVSSVEEEVAAAAEEEPAPTHTVGAQLVAPRALRPVASSWVTVEDVTVTWRDGEAPSAAAADDEAPTFVSDQWGRVTWTNAAFGRAVSAADDGDASAAEVRVGLAGALPAWGTCAGFTCRVRVRHASPRRGGSVVAPCDVWRLDAGGCYLWQLDLQAALTLGGLP